MRSRIFTFAALVVLSTALAHGQTPPPSPQLPMPRDPQAQQKTGTARLAGRVLSAETARPLRRALVRASSAELREGRSVSTDADGRWEIKELPAGRYHVSVSKAGYVSLSYGQRRATDQGKQIELADGHTIQKLDVSLPKGAVITGRIVDEFGEPVAGARVSALRYRFIQGQRQLVPFGMGDVTDDVGQYRLHGLSPGDYFVSAAFTGGFAMDVSADRTGYSTTYYPGTGAVAEAQRVTVSAAQEVSEISFALTPTRVATISGTVTTSAGRPVANQMIMLAPANLAMFFGPVRGMGRTRPDGSFTISNVEAGEYRLEARVAGETDGGPFGPGVAETASVPLSVRGRDISGLAIVTAPTATATGRVVFEGGVPPGLLPGAVSVFAPPESPMQFSLGSGPSRVRDDWTFEIRGLSGRRLIRAGGPPSGWALKSVTVNGQDVTDSAIEFKPGENLSGLEITLTQHLPSISGSVQGERNVLADDYVVVAFSSDSRRWGSQTRYVRSARPDQSGKFLLRALPPDDYLLVAVESLETGEESDPELLERLRRHATTVTLSEGDSKALTLKLTRER